MMFKTVPNLNFIVVCLCVVVMSCYVPDHDTEESIYDVDLNLSVENDWLMSENILSRINDHRIAILKSPLVLDSRYASAYAMDHSLYMIAQDAVSHDFFFRRSAGLKYHTGATKVSENIAYGYSSAESVVNAWLNSAEHKAIIEGDFSHIGFGIVKSEDERIYYTLLFYK